MVVQDVQISNIRKNLARPLFINGLDSVSCPRAELSALNSVHAWLCAWQMHVMHATQYRAEMAKLFLESHAMFCLVKLNVQE
jgi:hypothetical protein